MLERITLSNFKASRDLDVRLAGLTVLSGLNGSGKSTLLQALGVLRQSYDRTGNTKGLRLGGELVQLGDGVDVLSEGAKTETICISVLENGIEYKWEAAVHPDENQLQLQTSPAPPPNFVTAPHFQFLQADRIVPATLYPKSPQYTRDLGFLGVRGEFTADFLVANSETLVSEPRLLDATRQEIDFSLLTKVAPTRKLLDQIAGWYQLLSPGARLTSSRVRGTDEVILQFNYAGRERSAESDQYYRPTNVGFGLTYCLPIITACLAAPKGALLLLENPEAHLHPQGQYALGELIAQCVADGVQVILETHSDHLMNGIRLSVKRNVLPAETVALHFFRRSVKTGDVTVASPALLRNGRLSNWPTGFFDQWDKSIEALLD